MLYPTFVQTHPQTSGHIIAPTIQQFRVQQVLQPLFQLHLILETLMHVRFFFLQTRLHTHIFTRPIGTKVRGVLLFQVNLRFRYTVVRN